MAELVGGVLGVIQVVLFDQPAHTLGVQHEAPGVAADAVLISEVVQQAVGGLPDDGGQAEDRVGWPGTRRSGTDGDHAPIGASGDP
ncbi:MAG TPA: hypothetical protein VG276_02780, partial [Actinomycetes bacterium]|nr:hypothetical protein [Actinomycetes bacterium]